MKGLKGSLTVSVSNKHFNITTCTVFLLAQPVPLFATITLHKQKLSNDSNLHDFMKNIYITCKKYTAECLIKRQIYRPKALCFQFGSTKVLTKRHSTHCCCGNNRCFDQSEESIEINEPVEMRQRRALGKCLTNQS